MGEPLTVGEQFEVRSELGELMRISRIAIPGALYDASVSAQTSVVVGESIINPIDPEELADVNFAKVLGDPSHSHIP